MAGAPDFCLVDASEAGQHPDELTDLYREVYAEAPYVWGDEHARLFRERFAGQCQDKGFSLVEARHETRLIGYAFGVTLQPTTPWWRNLVMPLPDDMTREYPNRTFAVVELLVGLPWRRKHVAKTLHGLLLRDRPEERATLTVLPDALPAQRAYIKWGWRTVGQKRNPLPRSPVFDVMVKELG